ncbi:MAG: cytochrome c [Polyangiaceae bacterium]|nr:cytochrome c [Polyangiaceae bacterium]
MKDPIGMGQNDAVGKELMAKFKNVPMPNPNLNEMQIEAVLAYIDAESAKGGSAVEEVVALTGDKFDQAKGIYFDRCAGCHGTLRAGATGPNIQPERTKKIGGANLRTILTNGTPGGMPAWGREGVLTADQIALMATYVQMDPPAPPELPPREDQGQLEGPRSPGQATEEAGDEAQLGELLRRDPARRRQGRDHRRRHQGAGRPHQHGLRRAHPARLVDRPLLPRRRPRRQDHHDRSVDRDPHGRRAGPGVLRRAQRRRQQGAGLGGQAGHRGLLLAAAIRRLRRRHARAEERHERARRDL